MTETPNPELLIAKALIGWMDVFPAAANLNDLEPSSAGWDDYSFAEKAIARRAAIAIIQAISSEKSTETTS